MDNLQHGTAGTVHHQDLPALARFALDSTLHPTDELQKVASQTAATLFLKLIGRHDSAACVVIQKEENKVPAKTLLLAAIKAIAGFGSVEVCLVMESLCTVSDDRPTSREDMQRGFTLVHCTPASRRVFFHNNLAPDDCVFELNEAGTVLPVLEHVFDFALPLYAGRAAMRSWGNPGQAMTLERKACN